MTLQEKLKHYGLSEEEHKLAVSILGNRELSPIEWALFSSLWSEHCSYKSSKVHLKNIYNESDRLVSEDGENAGVVDLGEGERVAFKMESHNHPSFIEPFQGAATGVGGILRDIFTMGARPIALANYLCFGASGSHRLSQLVEGVVSGISFYGNCVGVPNITGQTEFDSTYNTNNLVNAFALGYYGKEDKIVSSKIKTPGFAVVYAGAKTGKDGVHGASMASESFDEGSESKRPTVQIGDPFYEKSLIESCLEVMKAGLVESVQDMGAAGITSSSFEMSVGGGLGLDLDLSKVPLRDFSMTPEEILLSESQERMLMTCPVENIEAVQKVFAKWGLEAVSIGHVRKEKEIRLFWQGDLVCEIDPAKIVEGAPRYERPFEEVTWTSGKKEGTSKTLSDLKEAYASLQGASRSWVYDQYDQRVGARTLSDCSEPLGSVLLPESKRSVAVALGCRPSLMKLSPVLGGKDAFLYPALQLSAKGYRPWAVTDCLNFGNPQKPKIMGEFVASLRALSSACELFEAPIISGNVSLYNETEGENITSTPATAVVGLNPKVLKEGDEPLKAKFKNKNSRVYLLETESVLEWSGYASLLKNKEAWGEGDLNLLRIQSFCEKLYNLAQSGKLKSAKVVGKFGPGYTLSQMISEKVGFSLSSDFDVQKLYSERLYQVVVEVEEEKALSDFESFAFLGETSEGGLLDFEKERYSFKEIQEISKASWEKHLGLQ